MGYQLLKNKKGIVFGALDDRSLAWRTALACYREGAKMILSNAPIALRFGHIKQLSKEVNAQIIACDMTKNEDITSLCEHVKSSFGKIDFVLHSIGMSTNIRKNLPYTELNYNWFHQTLDVSAISLHRFLHVASSSNLLNNGASIIALSYIGAQRIFSHYSDMNDAKALLESITRNFGSRLAKKGIRVNTISQGPTKTSAGSGIDGFDGLYELANKLSPLGNPSADECADYCVTLFSDLTRKVTMQNLFHDGGFSTAGLSDEVIKLVLDKKS